ncbi:EF-P 5-aminopentanol modification-associated protein YfmH [uncultured Enterococcus sp.]|uniref:EF-P 5-aminopentanol modification-associated protein YfmH n=1 Tax=uncultured Enterococcus sp. TaxID=167972 RepID=UPI0028058C4B|nr:pitrilysin family protein [uncultured Enterococcus sp.]
MMKKEYKKINETLYSEVLPNGLTVYLLPKPGFHKTYGLFTTDYGSIDNRFIPRGQKEFITVPDGIAHFLEHKMFEKETGDVFQDFGKQGASANAFTSFTKTSYLFSATDNIDLNLTTLLDFVQAPYFTAESVNKEKGIIGQEIQMYQDDPNWRQFFGIINNLYPEHPLHIDIAGTVESIDEITAEDLYTCYNTFYHPSNMKLFVVGNIDPAEMMTLIKENQAAKDFPVPQPIKREFPAETLTDIKKSDRLEMPVTRAKGILGIKMLTTDLPADNRELLRFKTAASLLWQLLLGSTSKNYLRLYDAGIIDDTFGYEFNLDRTFCFADFGGDSDEPQELTKAVQTILINYGEDSEINEANLTLLKKRMMGKFFQSLNSLEYIANQFNQNLFGDLTLFDLPEIIQSITLEDIYACGQRLINEDAMSEFFMYPKED